MAYLVIAALVAAWLLLAWLTVRIAYGKGRSPWLGAALGLLLPVVGLAIVTLMPSRSGEATLRQAAASQEQRAEQAEAAEDRDRAVRRSRRDRRTNRQRR